MRPFRELYLRCKESGNLIEVDISKHLKMMQEVQGVYNLKTLDIILVCVKYKSQCSSKVCKKERMGL